MSVDQMKHILVVEDEPHIAEGLRFNLKKQGFKVTVANDGVVALEKWHNERPDMIILDLMLPKLDGYSVLKSIRDEDERVPILILSAKDSVTDKVECLRSGVDDYLAKPFDLTEFLLRVERLLTRSAWSYQTDAETSVSDEEYTFGGNQIDFKRFIAVCKKGEIKLTSQELDLLKLFIENQGKPVSREELLERGWGYSQGTSTRTLDNFIVRFRKYFEDDPKEPKHFKSVRSYGYLFER